jgi:membrane protein DedA with SNARE-associated domain
MVTDAAPLIAVAGLIFVKEAGVPVPVPGDLVVLGAGVAAARGDLEPGVALVALVLASLAGGAIQYALLRSVARPALVRLLGRVASPERIDRQSERLRRSGARAVAVARMTPGVRIVTIAASALAAVPAPAFLGGLAVGNGVFIAAHFGLGFALGEPVVKVLGSALGPLAIAGVALAVVGLVGWLALRRRAGRPPVGGLATAAAWADACCPACLTLGALSSTR